MARRIVVGVDAREPRREPGLGTFAVKSILNVDYPAIMGITLFGAAFYVIVNLAVDLLQGVLDPRIRVA